MSKKGVVLISCLVALFLVSAGSVLYMKHLSIVSQLEQKNVALVEAITFIAEDTGEEVSRRDQQIQELTEQVETYQGILREVLPDTWRGAGIQAHTVVEGDWLSKLALTYYGDMHKWPVIYELNKDIIDDPDLIHPGQVLCIRLPAYHVLRIGE